MSDEGVARYNYIQRFMLYKNKSGAERHRLKVTYKRIVQKGALIPIKPCVVLCVNKISASELHCIKFTIYNVQLSILVGKKGRNNIKLLFPNLFILRLKAAALIDN